MIGAGKTTLIENFRNGFRDGFVTYPENVEFIKRMLDDKIKYPPVKLQKRITRRYEKNAETSKALSAVKVIERSAIDSTIVFPTAAWITGEMDIQGFHQIIASLAQDIVYDQIVYVRVPFEECKKRMQKRNRSFEAFNPSYLKYLEALWHIHEFIYTKMIKCVIIDGKKSAEEVYHEFTRMFSKYEFE